MSDAVFVRVRPITYNAIAVILSTAGINVLTSPVSSRGSVHRDFTLLECGIALTAAGVYFLVMASLAEGIRAEAKEKYTKARSIFWDSISREPDSKIVKPIFFEFLQVEVGNHIKKPGLFTSGAVLAALISVLSVISLIRLPIDKQAVPASVLQAPEVRGDLRDLNAKMDNLSVMVRRLEERSKIRNPKAKQVAQKAAKGRAEASTKTRR